jgi:urease subunit gamma/beta
MALTPGEHDRLLLHLQALLARERRSRGLQLNVPEATALIADQVCEWARDGLDLVAVRQQARALLSEEDVLPGVVAAVSEIRVEARFDDGTRLVVVPDPFGVKPPVVESLEQVVLATGSVVVTNEAPTDIGLTSHIHLAEVNPRLRLDRAAAFGMHPAIATGDTIWIRPGESIEIPVRPIEGARVQVGTSGVVDGPLDDADVRERALTLLRECGYLDIVDGLPYGVVQDADSAIALLMEARTHER